MKKFYYGKIEMNVPLLHFLPPPPPSIPITGGAPSASEVLTRLSVTSEENA